MLAFGNLWCRTVSLYTLKTYLYTLKTYFNVWYRTHCHGGHVVLHVENTFYRQHRKHSIASTYRVDGHGRHVVLHVLAPFMSAELEGLVLSLSKCQKRPTVGAKETYYMRTFESLRTVRRGSVPRISLNSFFTSMTPDAAVVIGLYCVCVCVCVRVYFCMYLCI